jgi:hypothetical protein
MVEEKQLSRERVRQRHLSRSETVPNVCVLKVHGGDTKRG